MDNPGATFVLKQKLVSVGGDAWIEDAQGNRAFEVDGKAIALRRTVKLMDTAGNELYHIAKSLMHLHRTFEIQKDGKVIATIQQGLIGFLGDKFKIEFENGDELQVKGDIIDHDFTIKRGDVVVIEASQKFFSLHNVFAVQVATGFENELAMAIVIALQQMESDERTTNTAAASSSS
jgi:uncharacterized protein YxjI